MRLMIITIGRRALCITILLQWMITVPSVQAEGAVQQPPQQTAQEEALKPVPAADNTLQYSNHGADTCIKCHDEDSVYPVFDIFKTKHAMRGDSRTPFAGLQCEACHGPGVAGRLFLEQALRTGSHVAKVRVGHPRPQVITFGPKSQQSVAVQNKVCLQCHQDDRHIHWQGSAHEVNDVACVSCHQIHTAEDAVLDKVRQPQVCYRCHQKQRMEFAKPSAHPVRFGVMSCSDCHDSHGSSAPYLLTRPSLNETCYTCHAEKRGPFLWEHEPVTEDCSLCHTAHGSIQPALLVKRPPLLCQQCHSQFGHPSVARTASGLPAGSASAFLLAGACTNCHSQVHGSNHPSGVMLMR